MIRLLQGPGFLGTHALWLSDFTLVLVLTTALMLTIGWRLAVHKHYTIHRWVQTTAATLNALIVLSTMIRSYVIHILPGIPAKLLMGDYALTSVHALTGALGLSLGIFVVLRANGLMPKALRFRNYKRFMRTSYGLYMAATLLGTSVYLVVYVLGI